LPIEHALLKLGVNKDLNLTVAQKRDNCQKFATEQIEKQKTQFKRLGLLTDFREIYRTFDHDYEQRQLELFLKMIDKKMIYQDFKPVY
jgi:isoleucyl-tRNA synthetase